MPNADSIVQYFLSNSIFNKPYLNSLAIKHMRSTSLGLSRESSITFHFQSAKIFANCTLPSYQLLAAWDTINLQHKNSITHHLAWKNQHCPIQGRNQEMTNIPNCRFVQNLYRVWQIFFQTLISVDFLP